MQSSSHRAGEKIRAWRKAAGLTAEQFADRAGVTLAMVYGWETQGKIARVKAQRRLREMGVCDAGDWIEPASPPSSSEAIGQQTSGEGVGEVRAGQSDAGADASGSEQVAA